MGAVGYAYQHGWAGTLYGVGGALGILLLAWWFAPLRELRFMTMSEELSYYVGADAWVKNLVAVLIFIACIGWLGAHILGGSMYLAWLTGISQNEAKDLDCLWFCHLRHHRRLYRSGVDRRSAGADFILWFYPDGAVCPARGGGLAGVAAIDQQSSDCSAWLDPFDIVGGRYSGRRVSDAIVSTADLFWLECQHSTALFVWSGVLYLGFCAIPALLGAVAWLLQPELHDPAFAFPYLALELLPWGLGLLVLLAGISATMSSARFRCHCGGVGVVARPVCADLAPDAGGGASSETLASGSGCGGGAGAAVCAVGGQYYQLYHRHDCDADVRHVCAWRDRSVLVAAQS